MMYVLLLLSIVLGVCKSGIYNRFAKAEKPDVPEKPAAPVEESEENT